MLDVQSNSGDGDEMNEMDMPNPGNKQLTCSFSFWYIVLISAGIKKMPR